MSEIEVSIIIVNYKTPDLLYACIKSIYDYSDKFRFEVIVVDNDSNDNSENLIKSNFKEVIWLNTGANLGFGTANNIGIEKS